jgi:hypothetical protein
MTSMLFWLLVACSADVATEERSRDGAVSVRLLYTGNVHGEIEPCG